MLGTVTLGTQMSIEKQTAAVIGVGMTKFSKSLDRGLGDLAAEAVANALEDAGLGIDEIDCVFSSNSVAGFITGQESIRGQVAMKQAGLTGRPIFNIENACASGSSALHLARTYILSGSADVVLVLGVEKLAHSDKSRSFKALEAATDVAEIDQLRQSLDASDQTRSIFMDMYAAKVRAYLAKAGIGHRVIAKVAAKNHSNGALNPYSQYGTVQDVESVLASRKIVDPLTLLMCAPISDGAAAVVMVSPRWCRDRGREGVRFLSSVVDSDSFDNEYSQMRAIAERAYAMAGIRASDIDVMEAHDAAAPAEIFAYEDMGLAEPGEGWKLVESGDVFIGGRVPVNPSGGLLARGHPIGATGVAQACELVWQLRGDAGARQVKGARIGVAHNRGGQLTTRQTTGSAAMSALVFAA
jgi:acetyl-CoA acyltransferase